MSALVENKISKRQRGGRKPRQTLRVAVVGATGYVGRELLLLLDRHPAARVTCLMSSGRDGKKPFPIEQVHPALTGRFPFPCGPLEVQEISPAEVDLVFLATPHETSAAVVPTLLDRGVRVVDLSGAFRLKEPGAYLRWYGFEHPASSALAEAVYGLPELNAAALREARLISNPGCYATSVILALAPLLRAGWLDVGAGLISDSKSGASGAGRAPSDKLHFPEVNENCRAYGLFHHRHVPEILQALGLEEKDFTFTPHLLPVNRGILSTVYVRLAERRSLQGVIALFGDFFAKAPLVRVYRAGTLPEIQGVAHTPYADLGFALEEPTRRLVVISALDNLGKGAAGQAVQNMNLMVGFPQETGLL